MESSSESSGTCGLCSKDLTNLNKANIDRHHAACRKKRKSSLPNEISTYFKKGILDLVSCFLFVMILLRPFIPINTNFSNICNLVRVNYHSMFRGSFTLFSRDQSTRAGSTYGPTGPGPRAPRLKGVPRFWSWIVFKTKKYWCNKWRNSYNIQVQYFKMEFAILIILSIKWKNWSRNDIQKWVSNPM